VELKDITTLEDTDHENFGRNYDFVGRVTPASHEAIEAFPTYIEGAIERFFKVAGFADNEKVVGQWAERFGLPDDLAVEMLDQATLIGEAPEGDNAGQAKKDLIDSLGKWARVRLLQRLHRDFCLGVLAMLRNHAVAAMGYLRVQCETAAIVKMTADSPDVGADWWHAITIGEGRAFYRRHNKMVAKTLKRAGLYTYYDIGSSMAMHSRGAGIVHGILYGGETEETDDTATIKVTFQDLDSPADIFRYFASYILAHKSIAKLVEAGLPELTAEQHADLSARFHARVGSVVRAAVQRFPLEQ